MSSEYVTRLLGEIQELKAENARLRKLLQQAQGLREDLNKAEVKRMGEDYLDHLLGKHADRG